MKRFSWLAFVLGAALHAYGTWLLFDAGMRESHLNYEGPRHDTALRTWAWVWLPVPMLLKPVVQQRNTPSREAPPQYRIEPMLYLAPSWSFVVGLCCGFLDPQFSRRRRKSPNQTMERAAEEKEKLEG